jgi:hypothetical protein
MSCYIFYSYLLIRVRTLSPKFCPTAISTYVSYVYAYINSLHSDKGSKLQTKTKSYDGTFLANLFAGKAKLVHDR